MPPRLDRMRSGSQRQRQLAKCIIYMWRGELDHGTRRALQQQGLFSMQNQATVALMLAHNGRVVRHRVPVPLSRIRQLAINARAAHQSSFNSAYTSSSDGSDDGGHVSPLVQDATESRTFLDGNQ